jgi:WD40 repeat protein
LAVSTGHLTRANLHGVRRRLLSAAAVVLALLAFAAGVAAFAGGSDPGRSRCGDVGDRQRVASPEGSRTAFVRCTEEGSAWLYVADRAGAGERRLVPRRYNCCYVPSESVVFRDPAWSPDAHRLAVVIEDVGGTDVWVVEASGASARRVTSGPGRERRPRWSADGRQVSYSTETGTVASAGVSGS